MFQPSMVHPAGITDIFRQQGQPNTCPDINIFDPVEEMYQCSLRIAPLGLKPIAM